MIYHEYKSLPESLWGIIHKSLKSFSGNQPVNILAPVCGDGLEISSIQAALQKKGVKSITHGLDPYSENVEKARENIDQAWTSEPDYFLSTPNTFGIVYINAPIETTESINERADSISNSEFKNFKSYYDTSMIFRNSDIKIHEQGLYILVIPIKEISISIGMKIACLKNVIISKIPDDNKRLLVVAQNHQGEVNEPDKIIRDTLFAITNEKASPIEIKKIHEKYIIPTSNLKVFSPSIIKMADAIYLGNKNDSCSKFLEDALNTDDSFPSPLTQVSPGHIASALIPAGFLNGELEINNEKMRLQGSIYQDVVSKTTTEVIGMNNKDQNGQNETLISSRKISQSEITMFNLNGKCPELIRVSRDQSTIFADDESNISDEGHQGEGEGEGIGFQ